MAGLSWIAVLLTISLSVGNSAAAVDQNYLRNSVQQIMNTYRIDGVQSCFAVNIPEDQTKLQEVFQNDPGYRVITVYGAGEVYTGTNVVAATFKKDEKSGLVFTEHAEARVLDNIQGLVERRADHILILYSSLSPCGDKCTNLAKKRYNILGRITKYVTPKWTDYAFVFTTVFDQTSTGRHIPQEETVQALTNLASAIGQNNIYRCYQPWGGQFDCIKCYNNGAPVDECIKND